MKINLNLTADIDKLRTLEAGTEVFLSGKILAARDSAHKRIRKITGRGEAFPVSLKNAVIYYMGPAPARDGYPIGSCGPTSSYRMDDYLEDTLRLGVVATIGKGERDIKLNKVIKKYKAPYLITIGGAGAYLAECVVSSELLLFEDLGAEAVRELIVKDFPVIVGIDYRGISIFKK